jgi:CelD/BcsL family acetyltransferase involved in cellulose biosynthesis
MVREAATEARLGVGMTVTRPAVLTLDDPALFASFRDEWDELLESSASKCLFLTWEWLYTWWKHLALDRRLFLLTVRENDLLTAILPLASRRADPQGTFLFETAEFLGTGTVGSDYLDVVVRRGHEPQALEALADALSRRHGRLVLSQAKEHASHASALADLLSRRGWRTNARTTSICPYIDLARHDWESYLASLGASHRYNFRRRLRGLSKQHEMKLETASSEEGRARILEALFRLHHRRWSTRGGSDAFQSQRLLAFHRELSAIALQRGWLRLNLLQVDGEPAASVYGFLYDGVFYFYQSGFDPRFAKESVGLVALGLTIQGAIGEGAREFDFLHGDEAYKFQWAREARTLAQWELYAPRLTSAFYKGLVDSARAALGAVRGVLHGAPAGQRLPVSPAIERRRRDAARLR